MTSREKFTKLQEELWELVNKHSVCLSSCTMNFIGQTDNSESIRRGIDITNEIKKKIEELLSFSETGVEWENQESCDKFRQNILGILTELESSRILYNESKSQYNTRRN